jgi:dihydroflavonol-4-reductase
MRIAVIGATGMLGHHTARAVIAYGHALTVVHRASSKLAALSDLNFSAAVADLDNREALTRALSGVDAVINCAGHYPTEPRPWRDDVAIATSQMENFYAACAGHPLKKIVYLGGAIALKRRADGGPADETQEYPGEPDNKNAYLQVKWAMDHQARQKAAAGQPVVIGIPSMTFGEYDPGPTTGRLMVEIANRSLPGYVRGRRNLIYAGDAGRGMVDVCEKGRPGERYLLTGSNMTMDELVAKIATLAAVPVPPAVPLPLAKLVSSMQMLRYRYLNGAKPKVDATAIAVMSAGQFLDGTKAARELGFRAEVSVDEALLRSLRWFRQNGYINH